MTKISVRDLHKQYDGAVIFEDVSFELADHAFCMLLGPSGVGKSTLLRILMSMERPTRGEVLLDGAPIDTQPQPDRGVVFQKYSVFPHLNVLQNVMLGPQLRGSPILSRFFGAPRRELRRRAAALLEEVGLSGALKLYPAQLSGGMQQRLALAQALIMEPKVLLLDEPFGALDQSTKITMHRLLIDLWMRNKMTVVMVTHDIQEAFTLGTRILFLDKKRLNTQDQGALSSTIVDDVTLNAALKTPITEAKNDSESFAMSEIFQKWREKNADVVIPDVGAAHASPLKQQSGEIMKCDADSQSTQEKRPPLKA